MPPPASPGTQFKLALIIFLHESLQLTLPTVFSEGSLPSVAPLFAIIHYNIPVAVSLQKHAQSIFKVVSLK